MKTEDQSWNYVPNEIISRTKELYIDCPECENIIYDDEQYQCGTCGGGSRINVFDWFCRKNKATNEALLSALKRMAIKFEYMAVDVAGIMDDDCTTILNKAKEAINNAESI